MPDDFYQQMDAAGILVNAGYQCCDFWEVDSTYRSADTGHPAELRADHRAEPAQPPERVQLPVVRQPADVDPGVAVAHRVRRGRLLPADPFISSAEYKSSPQLGACGREGGPVRLGPAELLVRHHASRARDSTVTNAGGSWGYDSEESAGNTVPTLDSLNRFLSASDQATLWQNPGRQPVPQQLRAAQHTGYAFGTLYNFDTAITNRYGAWSSLAQYVEEAQVARTTRTPGRSSRRSSTTRPTRRCRRPAPSTGSSTRAGRPCSGRSTTTTATRPAATSARRRPTGRLHALYALDNGTVTLDNLSGTSPGRPDGRVEGLQPGRHAARRPDRQHHHARHPAGAQQRADPEGADRQPGPGLLRRTAAQAERDRSSTATSTGCPPSRTSSTGPRRSASRRARCPSTRTCTALQTLPPSSVAATAATTNQAGPDGADRATTVTITNTSSSTVALLPAGRHPARHRRRPGTLRRQRAAVLDLEGQRHHAVARVSPRRSRSPGTRPTCKAPPRWSASPAGTSPKIDILA